MINIHSILKEIHKEILEKNPSIEIIDDQLFIDTVSGVEFHLYDDYFQMTRKDDKKSVSASSFTEAENATIMQIKNLITDPLVTADKKENYQQHITDNRSHFAHWFENPVPTKGGITEEVGTVEYVR